MKFFNEFFGKFDELVTVSVVFFLFKCNLNYFWGKDVLGGFSC